MELSELQSLWTKQDETMKENIRLNKEILRQLLLRKPEKRIFRIRYRSIFDLILPLVLLPIILPQIKIRNEPSFYIGAFLFGSFFILTYVWALKYFLKVMKIDFSNSLIILKKQIAELEKSKLKTTRIGYMFFPFVLTGIFMLGGFQIHEITFYSMLPLFLIVVVFASSVYITFKYSIFERFNMLNREISEIEKLGKDDD